MKNIRYKTFVHCFHCIHLRTLILAPWYFEHATWYLPPNICYLLLVTWYLSRDTCYLLLSTWYLPHTFYLLPCELIKRLQISIVLKMSTKPESHVWAHFLEHFHICFTKFLIFTIWMSWWLCTFKICENTLKIDVCMCDVHFISKLSCAKLSW